MNGDYTPKLTFCCFVLLTTWCFLIWTNCPLRFFWNTFWFVLRLRVLGTSRPAGCRRISRRIWSWRRTRPRSVFHSRISTWRSGSARRSRVWRTWLLGVWILSLNFKAFILTITILEKTSIYSLEKKKSSCAITINKSSSTSDCTVKQQP